jgi:predicted RNA binding protein YcfA (HicA-like mRNA interferase family)
MTDADFSQLRTVTARRIVTALERDGFVLARQTGSHRHYKNIDGRRVTVSFHHSSDTFRPKTLRSMIEAQARWTWEDIKRLQLI